MMVMNARPWRLGCAARAAPAAQGSPGQARGGPVGGFVGHDRCAAIASRYIYLMILYR